MDIVTTAESLLRETEKRLRELVSLAATSGDYASVVRVASWAKTVSELVGTEPGRRTGPPAIKPESIPTGRKPSFGVQRPKRAIRRVDLPYPRFLRRGDELVRIAWSKREKKEYRHRVPYDIVKTVAEVVSGQGREGRIFSTDKLLPLADPADGSPVPNYQAYVAISLFKQTGLLDQHGRQGYSIPRPADFRQCVEAVWKKLPQE